MIVSSTKRREVLAALESSCVPGGDIVLRGPSGSGKTTALECACRELNIKIIRYEGIGGDIRAFLGSALRLQASGLSRIVAYFPGADVLAFYCRNYDSLANIPICKVFSIEEGCPEYFTAVQKLPRAKFISFNAFSEYALTKGLIENVDPNRVCEARSIIQGCGGDIRQATNQLISAGVFVEEKGQSNLVSRKRRKPINSTDGQVVADPAVTDSKDAMYSFFHILGKILYNKEGAIRNVDNLVDDPIITNSGYNIADWIHENLIDFVADVDNLASAYESIVLVDSWRRNGFEMASIATWVVFKSVCIRSAASNVSIKRSFRPLRKPASYACASQVHETLMFLRAGEYWLRPELLPIRSQIFTRASEAHFPTETIDSDPIEDCE